MRVIGILGGMGPEASADLYLRIIRICQQEYGARFDEDYPQILINSITPPDVVGKGVDWPRERVAREMERLVLPFLLRGAKTLERAGADFIVIACNTVQYFVPTLRKEVSVPVISTPEEVAKTLRAKGIGKALLLATTNTLKLGVYDLLMNKRIEVLKPSEEQQERVNEIILRLMGGEKEREDKDFLLNLIREFEQKGVGAVILGCTELPLLVSQQDVKACVIDTTQLMAEVAIKLARG